MDSEIIDVRNIDISQDSNKPNLSNDFTSYLKTAEQIKSLGYNPNAPCTINFYEWSNLSMKRIFTSVEEFEKFMKDSELTMKYWEENMVKRMSHQGGVHIICKPQCKDLLIEPTYVALESSFKFASSSKTSGTTYNPHMPMCCSPAYSRMYYTRNPQDWDDWD